MSTVWPGLTKASMPPRCSRASRTRACTRPIERCFSAVCAIATVADISRNALQFVFLEIAGMCGRLPVDRHWHRADECRVVIDDSHGLVRVVEPLRVMLVLQFGEDFIPKLGKRAVAHVF